ncbi:TonB-dependent siderophore receptor [Chitinophaga sp. Cy-1792]|uniref:TonB-dependent receptor plug domain-containing protein n=1 Tax=Chitinophaga sp. Cy-1792 TaxID=2608339 RepID=UPI001422ED27|nr:TonB-dependent receptor [Chitinophaga sp. Cy-1792]NIG56398.1 TonB-dependent receptor [Chitinophaga sp. Cy-1792]
MLHTLLLLLPFLSDSTRQTSAIPGDTTNNIGIHHLKGIQVQASSYKKSDDLINIKKIANPTLVIDAKTIQQMGSRRLDEVLREQTGMAVVSDLGAGNRSIGIQMQGFSSAYVLVLLNGLPLSGRFNENFDISRLSIHDIQRIEIIKGASSSLYGSEALGGVINIITRPTVTSAAASVSALYGSFHTADISASAAMPFAQQKGSMQLQADYYRTAGFNVNNQYLQSGQTSPPYSSYTLQSRSSWQLNQHNTLQFSGRYASRNSVMDRSYGAQPFRDRLQENDLNAALVLNTNVNEHTQLLTRYYFTWYQTDQSVKINDSGKLLQENDFSQNIHRLELQGSSDYLENKLQFTGGVGGELQQLVQVQRVPAQTNYFGYVQANYQWKSGYALVAGVRYDGNSFYGGRFNPSIGGTVTPVKWLELKASVGQGFKSPTYAQSYQLFTNITQGYTVAGANIFTQAVADLKKAGLLQSVWDNAGRIQPLQPETATSYNLTATFRPGSRITVAVNGFYNNIRHLINTEQVGIMRNGQQLFSYLNLGRAYTTGLEASMEIRPVQDLKITGGYQYLIAKNKDVEDSIRAGAGAYAKVRAENGIRAATVGDYFGLPNRSRHMANIQAYYTWAPWKLSISLRATYRGKYGFLDLDNNGYIDRYDVFVKGYTLLYFSVQKRLWKDKLELKCSIDNVTGYTDYLMPAQPGRMITGGFTWHFIKR